MFYVGKYDNRPIGCEEIPEKLRFAHPSEFEDLVPEFIDGDWWTNNPSILDYVPPDQVTVCFGCQWQLLTDHPSFEKWRDESTAGEFWSWVGEEWVAGLA